ncbi:NAD-dependent epimerase/dehydratase family protein [Chitinophaga sp. NPDC101104]|uniref:NAD-dependent epimerase/dehydratase family protein n=1 Tax=Chitinophaga sp. NPDC101104 TaxID=3390561 RepID=UPI003D00936C
MKKALLTGANGFLGRWISEALEQSGFRVATLGRSECSEYRFDLINEIPGFDEAFDLVVHAAGKAHVAVSTAHPAEDFRKVNTVGTMHLLSALDSQPPAAFVLISTVAVYGVDTGNNISEDAPLLASDPYGSSKIEAEKAVRRWCEERNVKCSILRLPLVAGPNPPGNLNEMINGIQKGRYANIGNGSARKSIVLASDVAAIIATAAENPGIYNLTDGYHPTFCELSMHIAQQLGRRKVPTIPFWLARILSLAGDLTGGGLPINSLKFRKITLDLTFEDTRARTHLGWKPTPVLQGFKIK